MEDKKVINKYLDEQSKWLQKAKQFTNKDNFKQLSNKAFKKMENGNDKLQDGFKTIRNFIMMITDFFKNDFLIDKKELLMMIGGLVYFISPIDIVPDFIPVVGLLDDMAVILFIAKQLTGTVTHYEEYKRDFEIKDDVIDVTVEEE